MIRCLRILNRLCDRLLGYHSLYRERTKEQWDLEGVTFKEMEILRFNSYPLFVDVTCTFKKISRPRGKTLYGNAKGFPRPCQLNFKVHAKTWIRNPVKRFICRGRETERLSNSSFLDVAFVGLVMLDRFFHSNQIALYFATYYRFFHKSTVVDGNMYARAFTERSLRLLRITFWRLQPTNLSTPGDGNYLFQDLRDLLRCHLSNPRRNTWDQIKQGNVLRQNI